jgi:hypothetical protein
VRWYLRYSLSLRDVEELFAERGLAADHTTIWRWVQRYGPELEQRLRRQLKPTNQSRRIDETIFVSRAGGVTATGPIRMVRLSTFCCQRYVMLRRPNGCSARRSPIPRIRNPA